uniref:Fibrinogen C-terminal domain-containing protein n=1 Tax=Plectus sambesii TaxID=2011161 RepID=A0A914W6Y0_9BILA
MRVNCALSRLFLLLACILYGSLAQGVEEESSQDEPRSHLPSLEDLQQQIVALRRDRDLDRTEIQTLRKYCETEKLSAMIERQKQNLNDLQWNRAHRRMKRSLMDPYITLASKLETVRSEVEAIRLLEDDQMPVLKSDLDKQQVQLSQLLNLTAQLAQELNKLKRQKHNREENTVIDYTPTEMETIKNRLWHIDQRMTDYEDYMKWDEFWSHRIQEQFSELIRNATLIHSNLESKISLTSSSNTVDNELLFSILNGEDSLEGSGSGDAKEEFLPPSSLTKSDTNHQWPYQLAAEVFKLRLLHVESATRFDKLGSKVDQVVLMQKKLREKLDQLNGTKADRTNVQNLTAICQKTAEKMVQLESSLGATTQKANAQNDATQNATNILRLEIKVMKQQTQRAEKIAEVIKKVQNDHFNAIMNFSERVNIMDSDVTKYALKLTTLQADFLNATLFLYKESRNDNRQDAQIARLELRVEKNELRFPDLSREIKALTVNLNDKIGYEKFKRLNDAVVEGMDKLTMQSSVLVNLERTTNVTVDSVRKLETQLTYDCSMDNVLAEAKNYADGVYLIKPKNFTKSIYVACQDSWTIIQRREHGLNFNRTFDEYASGFGDAHTSDYWMGNEIIHSLTSRTPMALRIDTWDIFDDYRTAVYVSFSIGNHSDFYRLHIGEYKSGNLTDSLSAHQGMEFSAYDEDKDASSIHCARYHLSGE